MQVLRKLIYFKFLQYHPRNHLKHIQRNILIIFSSNYVPSFQSLSVCIKWPKRVLFLKNQGRCKGSPKTNKSSIKMKRIKPQRSLQKNGSFKTISISSTRWFAESRLMDFKAKLFFLLWKLSHVLHASHKFLRRYTKFNMRSMINHKKIVHVHILFFLLKDEFLICIMGFSYQQCS